MENVQETIEKITTNFNSMKSQIEKLTALIEDINKCDSEYTKTILLSAITKLADSAGLKEKLIG